MLGTRERHREQNASGAVLAWAAAAAACPMIPCGRSVGRRRVLPQCIDDLTVALLLRLNFLSLQDTLCVNVAQPLHLPSPPLPAPPFLPPDHRPLTSSSLTADASDGRLTARLERQQPPPWVRPNPAFELAQNLTNCLQVSPSSSAGSQSDIPPYHSSLPKTAFPNSTISTST